MAVDWDEPGPWFLMLMVFAAVFVGLLLYKDWRETNLMVARDCVWVPPQSGHWEKRTPEKQ